MDDHTRVRRDHVREATCAAFGVVIDVAAGRGEVPQARLREPPAGEHPRRRHGRSACPDLAPDPLRALVAAATAAPGLTLSPRSRISVSNVAIRPSSSTSSV